MSSLATPYDLNPRAWFDCSSVELILLCDFRGDLTLAELSFEVADVGMNEQCEEVESCWKVSLLS